MVSEHNDAPARSLAASRFDPSRMARARLYAASIFRSHDWRVSELIEGRWDHHPMVLKYLSRDSDGNPKGGNEVPSRSDDSAGRETASPTPDPDTHNQEGSEP